MTLFASILFDVRDVPSATELYACREDPLPSKEGEARVPYSGCIPVH